MGTIIKWASIMRYEEYKNKKFEVGDHVCVRDAPIGEWDGYTVVCEDCGVKGSTKHLGQLAHIDCV